MVMIESWPGDIDPVSIGDIAAVAKVTPDAVKKWADRHPDTFPKPIKKVRGARVWVWGDVRRWLQDTGRLPRTIRYRDGGGAVILAQTLDGDDKWRTVAQFTDIGLGDWRAMPGPHAWEILIGPKPVPTDDEAADEIAKAEWVERRGEQRSEAQAWAQRLLQEWDQARADWAREHPDEPMPAHLIGGQHPAYDDRAELAVQSEGGESTLRAERERLRARLAEIDAELPETE